MKSTRQILIVGLGNPGVKYENTRHNIGFNIVDAIAYKYSFPDYSNKFSSLICNKVIDTVKITLLKPQLYMNLSGYAISQAINFYKINVEELIVIHDDLDLQFAKVKMKIGGGSGGHNGIKSIDQHVGSNYYRLRIGIGKPDKNYDISNYVLANFSPSEVETIHKLESTLLENFNLILNKDLSLLMNKMAMEHQKYGI